MSQEPKTPAEQKRWIDACCDNLGSKIKSSDFDGVERKDDLMNLIESGVFLSAILGELVSKPEKVKPDMREKSTKLFNEFRSIVEDMERE